jgi:DNA-binding NtrC family response regulator
MAKHRILVVEDNATKQAEIENALQGEFEILSTKSIAGAYRLISGTWDLVVLDMTFQVGQTRGHESAKEALAGIELLQYMASRSIEVPVVVATQHTSFTTSEMPAIDSIAKLHTLLADAFPETYRHTVEVDLSEETWKTKLREIVRSVLSEDRA